MTPHPHLSRREALQVGAVGLLGLGMNHLQALPAMSAPGSQAVGRAKSVVYIFLSGGLAQQESFDPKPEAPMEMRGEFKTIRTQTPGLHVCEHLPRLAAMSRRLPSPSVMRDTSWEQMS